MYPLSAPTSLRIKFKFLTWPCVICHPPPLTLSDLNSYDFLSHSAPAILECALKHPVRLPPRGLCTGCSFYLEYFSPDSQLVPILTSSGLYSNVTFSKRASLITLYKVVTSSTTFPSHPASLFTIQHFITFLAMHISLLCTYLLQDPGKCITRSRCSINFVEPMSDLKG